MPQASSSPRIIAIGDIHGCSIALAKLIAAVTPSADDIPTGRIHRLAATHSGNTCERFQFAFVRTDLDTRTG